MVKCVHALSSLSFDSHACSVAWKLGVHLFRAEVAIVCVHTKTSPIPHLFPEIPLCYFSLCLFALDNLSKTTQCNKQIPKIDHKIKQKPVEKDRQNIVQCSYDLGMVVTYGG